MKIHAIIVALFVWFVWAMQLTHARLEPQLQQIRAERARTTIAQSLPAKKRETR